MAECFTLQLNTSASQVDKGQDEHYTLALDPPIDVPADAQPRCQLETFAFQNAFTNVDSTLENHQIQFAWRSYVAGGTNLTSPENNTTAWRTLTVSLDDGHYSLDSLEYALARKVYEVSSGSAS